MRTPKEAIEELLTLLDNDYLSLQSLPKNEQRAKLDTAFIRLNAVMEGEAKSEDHPLSIEEQKQYKAVPMTEDDEKIASAVGQFLATIVRAGQDLPEDTPKEDKEKFFNFISGVYGRFNEWMDRYDAYNPIAETLNDQDMALGNYYRDMGKFLPPDNNRITDQFKYDHRQTEAYIAENNAIAGGYKLLNLSSDEKIILGGTGSPEFTDMTEAYDTYETQRRDYTRAPYKDRKDLPNMRENREAVDRTLVDVWRQSWNYLRRKDTTPWHTYGKERVAVAAKLMAQSFARLMTMENPPYDTPWDTIFDAMKVECLRNRDFRRELARSLPDIILETDEKAKKGNKELLRSEKADRAREAYSLLRFAYSAEKASKGREAIIEGKMEDLNGSRYQEALKLVNVGKEEMELTPWEETRRATGFDGMVKELAEGILPKKPVAEADPEPLKQAPVVQGPQPGRN